MIDLRQMSKSNIHKCQRSKLWQKKNTIEEMQENKKYTLWARVQTIGVIDINLVLKFMIKNKMYFCDFCYKCGVKMWDMRNLLLRYHRPSPNEDFYKIARVLKVPVKRLFKGISDEAKERLKKYQNPLPCEID